MSEVTTPAGETYAREVVIYTDDTKATPEDLTGGTVRLELLTAPRGQAVADGVATITNAEAGKVTASIPNGVTNDLPYSVLYAQVTYTDSDGRTYLVDSWKHKVSGRV